MRRLTFTLTLVMLTGLLQAQSFRARVIDLVTKEPVSGATVRSQSSTVTDGQGHFSLRNIVVGDTIRITHLGYQPYSFTFNALHPGLAAGPSPEISLQPNNIVLNEVFVKSFRNQRADSLKNRRDFAAAFAYRPPGVKDMFVVKSPEEAMARHVDVHKGNNALSASNLVKVDVLKALSLLAKKNSGPSKLQKILLQEEADEFIDQRFSKQRITDLTNLAGDSLKTFIIRYRPALTMARTMTDYEMIAYIRKKYLEFLK